MATTRRTNRHSAQHARARTSRWHRRGGAAPQSLIIGAFVLILGILLALGIAIGAHNDTHPALRWMPALPIFVGLGLLMLGLMQASARAPSAPSRALEPYP